jgi:ferredoxin--NADP+ reductase
VIGTNKVDSQQTVAALLDDYGAGELIDPPLLGDDVSAFVAAKSPDFVDGDGWRRIDAAEKALGAASAVRRVRTKIISVDDLLAASRL